MRKPTPVTISSITAESGSESRPKSVWSEPDATQLKMVMSLVRLVSAVPSIEMKSATAAAKASRIVPQPIQEIRARGRRRPNSPRMTKPASGRASVKTVKFSMLALQGVELVHVNLAAGAEDGDDDGEADHHLGGGDGQHEEDEHPALHRVQEVRERHEREVDGVEHQLDGHEHHQRVAAHEHADRADGEEQRADDQIGVERHSVASPLFALAAAEAAAQHDGAHHGDHQQHARHLEGEGEAVEEREAERLHVA